jgi:outer membrane lipoprotein-sorting protein
MKHIIVLFMALFCISFSYSQSDPKAEKLINEVLQKVKSYENINVKFSYNLENKATNTSEETRGEVYINGEKYRLELDGNIIIYDGKKMYTIDQANEEVKISSVYEDDATITPSKMLTFFEDGYNYKWDIEQNQSGRMIQYIKLIPIDSEAEYKSVLLGTDKYTKNVSNVIYTMDNGTRTELKIYSFKTNEPLSENLFKFDKSKYMDFYFDEQD